MQSERETRDSESKNDTKKGCSALHTTSSGFAEPRRKLELESRSPEDVPVTWERCYSQVLFEAIRRGERYLWYFSCPGSKPPTGASPVVTSRTASRLRKVVAMTCCVHNPKTFSPGAVLRTWAPK